MKSVEKILEEINHQENKYQHHRRCWEKAKDDDSELGRLKTRDHLQIMGRHAARQKALLWVLEKDAVE